MLEILSRSIAHAGGIDVAPQARFLPEKTQPAPRHRRKITPLVRKVLAGAWTGARKAWIDGRRNVSDHRDLTAATG